MRAILVLCILLAIGLVAAISTGYYLGGSPVIYRIHTSLGIAGIALVAYLTYEAFHKSKSTIFRILATIVLILALIQIVTGILAIYPEIHSIAGPTMLVLAAITGYMGYISSKTARH